MLPALPFPDTPPPELNRIEDWWRFAVSLLHSTDASFGQSSIDAGQDAVFLVLGALALPLDSFAEVRTCAVTAAESQRLYSALRRRVVERVPTAYVLGFAEQMGLRFVVNENVLIPRSFIGELLQDGLVDCLDDADAVASVLDLCTGSGCLAILAAHAFPYAQVVGTDISAAALDVARANVLRHQLDAVVTLKQGDLFVPLKGQRFDVILSNPPYVTTDSMAALPLEYQHEPSLALAAGDDGNDILRRILKDARRHLTPYGVLVVDMGHNRDLVEAAFPTLPFLWLSTAAHDGGVFALRAGDLP
ncbi:MAG: 50S ribosomal protein L3 N(5)-glutamine methyltransferase [Burkholderiales bacterium]|nr:50S ribosomal protein L3 N(5)-glutamine methyltransferase [Burkholderiales bacterium]